MVDLFMVARINMMWQRQYRALFNPLNKAGKYNLMLIWGELIGRRQTRLMSYLWDVRVRGDGRDLLARILEDNSIRLAAWALKYGLFDLPRRYPVAHYGPNQIKMMIWLVNNGLESPAALAYSATMYNDVVMYRFIVRMWPQARGDSDICIERDILCC